MKKFITIIGLAAAVSLAGGHAQVFIGDPTPSAGDTGVFAYWNFNDIATDGSALTADFYGQAGSTSISFDGYGGNLASFGGSSINAQDGASAGDDLALQNGTDNAINDTFIEIAFDMSNLEDLSIDYKISGTGTGADSAQWSYSTDGSTFTDFGADVGARDVGNTLASDEFGSISTSALDGASTAYVRLTFDVTSGGSSAGNNRMDNLTFEATAIPEPGTWALIGLGSAVVLWRMRRRNTTA